MEFTYELEREDETLSLEIEITSRGYPAVTTGPPDRWDPGDPPEWRVTNRQVELTSQEEQVITEKAEEWLRC